ncbi:hypothetical protein GCM10027075_51030 [Streptomyces heilongjiangensis]
MSGADGVDGADGAGWEVKVMSIAAPSGMAGPACARGAAGAHNAAGRWRKDSATASTVSWITGIGLYLAWNRAGPPRNRAIR